MCHPNSSKHLQREPTKINLILNIYISAANPKGGGGLVVDQLSNQLVYAICIENESLRAIGRCTGSGEFKNFTHCFCTAFENHTLRDDVGSRNLVS